MTTFVLRRVSEHQTFGTFGIIEDAEGIPICLSLEEPWRENARNISCIPPGNYQCKEEYHQRLKARVFRFAAVEGRDGILMHVGNTLEDTEGCILTGSSFGFVRGVPGVLGSGAAFKELRNALRGEKDFTLSIRAPIR